MDKEEIVRLSSELGLDKNIELDEIPEIDLYMDQVMQLFESKFLETKRKSDDKLLTKTMINNYAKAKLFMPINKKKYSKDHLIMLSFIYNLKGALSIGDIKQCLDEIVTSYENDEKYPLRELYIKYLTQYNKDLEDFNCNMDEKLKQVNKLTTDEFEEKFLLINSFINMSNMYRRMGEKIIDECFSQDNKEN
ncbi:MAG: DUF1836 domain-containing protein [Clostridium sp.]